jgi:ABC-type spermidine/putrescine transport system permease subunit II
MAPPDAFHDVDYVTWHPTRLMRGLRHRIVASIEVFAGGAIALILYFAFVASRFSWWQNLAVLACTLIAIPAIIAGIWISWALSAWWDR